MSEYEQSLRVRASADTVFRFAADVQNLPLYLPTTHAARAQGGGRVVVEGEAKGNRYAKDGFLLADPDGHRLAWGSDEGHYSGWMQVVDTHEGGAVVTVHLTMRRRPGDGTPHEASDADIEAGLRAGLEAIRDHVEVDRPAYDEREAHAPRDA